MSTAPGAERKGHVCPPSTATHPSDRWETLFVYSFIRKFTHIREKVEGFATPMDFEEALMSREPNPILVRVLMQFVLNLKPLTRNLSVDQISTTVASVLSEYFKSSERTVFWNEDLKMNVDPFQRLRGGFFAADWDFKLKILRQLVELQLSHSTEIKGLIDRAWGVSLSKHKKKDAAIAPPDTSDPNSQENLQLVPLGQDCRRKRYWVADDSPRVWVSTNPWKITATFQAISSTKEEYLAIIEELRQSAPSGSKKRSRIEQSHFTLIDALEERIPAIDAEIARIQRVQRRLEKQRALMAAAEFRETRTRRQTQRPDYVYNDFQTEDEADEYVPQDVDANDEDFDDDYGRHGRGQRRAASSGYRRSTRSAALNAYGKRASPSDPWISWRGERRSSRLGAPPEVQLDYDPPPKRARTEDSVASATSAESRSTSIDKNASINGLKLKSSSAAALKPTEIAMEQIEGKKRSKFWVYAVEPAPTTSIATSDTTQAEDGQPIHSDTSHPYTSNGGKNGVGNGTKPRTPSSSYTHESGTDDYDYSRSIEGSLSPVESP